MLRLARGAEAKLPSGAALSGWVERAAAMLDLSPMMVGPQSRSPGSSPASELASEALRSGARA